MKGIENWTHLVYSTWNPCWAIFKFSRILCSSGCGRGSRDRALEAAGGVAALCCNTFDFHTSVTSNTMSGVKAWKSESASTCAALLFSTVTRGCGQLALTSWGVSTDLLSSAYKPTNDCSWLLPPFLPLCLHTLYSSFPVLLVLPGTSPASGPLHLPFFHPKTLFPIIFTWLAPHFRSFSRVTSHSTKRPSRTSQAKQKPSRSTL